MANSSYSVSRGEFNQLNHWPDFAKKLAANAEKTGAWKVGIESDKKRRGTAINVDLFGYDEPSGLAVVQVRQCEFHPRRHNRVRKNYYLIGNTENGNFFAHPVDTPARSKAAMTSPEATVRYVLAKIWGCRERDLGDIVRQGDVAFVPVSRIPDGAEKIDGPVTIRGTHVVTGDLYRSGETYYAKRTAKITHAKHQHATKRVRGGIYRIAAGHRAASWGFTTPKGD